MVNNIFDSHAHYNDPAFNEDADEILSALPSKGISYIVNVGYSIDISKYALEQSEKYPFLYFSAGIHPHESDELPSDYISQLESIAKHPKCVAIGEIGLDYFRNEIDHNIQKKVFNEQIELAKALNKPIIIHSREAMSDTFEVLKTADYNNGVVHCFSGSAESATELVKMGFYIGFTGVVTFNNAKKAVKAAQAVPLDRLLVETDCPYMAPVPNRGKRCTSDMIFNTAEKLAEIKGISTQELLDITNANAMRMYGIK